MLRSGRTGTPAEFLVIGLGNPTSDYEGTRHNVGADALSLLANRYGARLRRGKAQALSADIRVGDHLVALAFPQTFVNDSGRSVVQLVRRHGIDSLSRLIVLHDELDLPVGRLQVKVGGGIAGHNGLKSLRDHLHSADFLRVRIGVGRPPGRQAGADYVLRRPSKVDRAELDLMVVEAADAVEMIVVNGVERAMNRYNSRASDPQ